MIKGQFIGLKEANRALRKLPEFARAEVQQTMDTTAFQVANGAKARAPRRTGALANAIGWKSRPRSLSAVVGINVAAAPHWRFVEYGTVKMAAKPFLRPSALSMESNHAGRLGQALSKALTRTEREIR